MPRTTTAAVREIIDTKEDIRLEPFIRTANAVTDWLSDKDVAADNLLSSALLTEIETYLAAHFYAHRDQLLQSKSTDRASGSYQGQTAMILLSTQYGQTAVLLDVTGFLAQRSADAQNGARRRAGITWLGTEADSPRPDEYGESS